MLHVPSFDNAFIIKTDQINMHSMQKLHIDNGFSGHDVRESV